MILDLEEPDEAEPSESDISHDALDPEAEA
jgi:hypothetical protein